MTSPSPSPFSAQDADIAIGHRNGAVVARNISGSPGGDLVLARLGFVRHPDNDLHTLLTDDREARTRAAEAVRTLRAARYSVLADHGLDPDLPTSEASKPAPDQRPSLEPQTAFALNRTMGIVAAVSDGVPHADAVLTAHGFRHQPHADIYVLPPGTPPQIAITTTARATRTLQSLGITVAVDPRIGIDPTPAKRQDPLDITHLTSHVQASARTGQVAAALEELLDHPDDPIGRLHELLESAALWITEHAPQHGDLAQQLREAGERLSEVGDLVYAAHVDLSAADRRSHLGLVDTNALRATTVSAVAPAVAAPANTGPRR